LGYYRRARNLHRAAQIIIRQHGGRVPRDEQEWRRLPGVGRYMAGAILSQAFDKKLPIVETNSQRVLCRLFGQTGDVRRSPLRQWLWRAAAAILPVHQVGDFNQALMELGALVCTSGLPQCTICPLFGDCLARMRGQQGRIPARLPRPSLVQIDEVAVVTRKGPFVLLVQRPEGGRWPSLWEFPHLSVKNGESYLATAARGLHDLTGIRANIGPRIMTIHHSVTYHRIRLTCVEAHFEAGKPCSGFYAALRWVRPARLPDYPTSSPQRRLARMLCESHEKPRF
jgi:A/G-specific adenine glycosylase